MSKSVATLTLTVYPWYLDTLKVDYRKLTHFSSGGLL